MRVFVCFVFEECFLFFIGGFVFFLNYFYFVCFGEFFYFCGFKCVGVWDV